MTATTATTIDATTTPGKYTITTADSVMRFGRKPSKHIHSLTAQETEFVCTTPGGKVIADTRTSQTPPVDPETAAALDAYEDPANATEWDDAFDQAAEAERLAEDESIAAAEGMTVEEYEAETQRMNAVADAEEPAQKRAPTKKATAKKATPKRAPAKKATAKKAPAKDSEKAPRAAKEGYHGSRKANMIEFAEKNGWTTKDNGDKITLARRGKAKITVTFFADGLGKVKSATMGDQNTTYGRVIKEWIAPKEG